MQTINTSRYDFLHHTRLEIQPSMLDLDSRKRILIYTFIELLVSCVLARMLNRREQFAFMQRGMAHAQTHARTTMYKSTEPNVLRVLFTSVCSVFLCSGSAGIEPDQIYERKAIPFVRNNNSAIRRIVIDEPDRIFHEWDFYGKS